jgi:UDP-N-acetyl-D-glucosamine dehydrogenase
MSFYPGPGVGGHCIPVDPFYLSWKAKEYDFFTHFIELAAEVNANMPYYVKDKALRLLRGGRLEEKKVFVLGVAFKRDIGDLRNSPALKVISLLRKEGVNVTYNDPYIPEIEVDGERILSKGLNEENIKEADLIILITDHTSYDYEMIARQASRILDTRNAFRGVRSRERVVKI